AITVWFFAKRKRKVLYRPRWDGGVRHFLSEMTYTATGFAQPVRVIFDMILHPNVTNEHKNVAEHFRVKIQRRKEEIHLVDRLILYPAIKLTQKLATTLAKMHSGRINTYASYGLLSLIILLGISFIF
ncbi:MAG: hypothetical protein GXP61_09635, partial [Epsilonproteobacteria bacterium]|nr:hypothetical protein [Campylobacterota bacterium]